MSNVDWSAIRADYENGLSLRQLAEKYRVSKSVIGKRKYEEKWIETRRTDSRTAMNTQEVIHSDRNAAVRAAIGFKMRFEEGKTWEDVAAGASYASRGAARNAVLRESHRHITHDLKEIRDEELYRLNQLQMRCYKAGINENNEDWTWAIDRFTALSKRKSELMGLDMPVDAAVFANQIVIREVPQGYLAAPEVKL